MKDRPTCEVVALQTPIATLSAKDCRLLPWFQVRLAPVYPSVQGQGVVKSEKCKLKETGDSSGGLGSREDTV